MSQDSDTGVEELLLFYLLCGMSYSLLGGGGGGEAVWNLT
jgi:hypothetical protein